MDYALDTCVGIGFTFCPDRYYPPANNFISTTQKELYWTSKVKSEYNIKYSKIHNSFTYFSNNILEVSRRNDGKYFDNYYSFEKLFLKNTHHINLDNHKKIKIIRYLWNKINNIINFHIIKDILINSLATFDERKTLLSRKLNYHKCGSDIHRKYAYLSQKFLENGGHHPDDIVLIEAHNLGLIHTISLITFDENMCKACSKIKELSIKCILCEKSD